MNGAAGRSHSPYEPLNPESEAGGNATEPSSPVRVKHVRYEPLPPEATDFAVGERVSYYSATHNQWLSARVLRSNFDGEGSLRSYDLDVRKNAPKTKIRHCLPDFHDDEEAVKQRIEGFRPPLWYQVGNLKNKLVIRFKRMTSHGRPLRLKKKVKFAVFAMDPIVDALTVIILLVNRQFGWATICALCIAAPYMALCALYKGPWKNRRHVQRAGAFKATFENLGRNPTLAGIFKSDYLLVLGEWYDRTSDMEQNYERLRHNLQLVESGPWIIFLLCIFAQQFFFGVDVIPLFWLLISLCQSLFNVCVILESMMSHASLASNGDLTAHVDSLVSSVGAETAGAVPCSVLEKLWMERDVVITEDLKALDRRGFRAISLAMGRSQVTKSVIFRNTGLDGYVNENADELEKANYWAHWCCDFCDNRSILEAVTFTPMLEIPSPVWQEVHRFNTPVLREIWNGDELVFHREEHRAPLEVAVDENHLKALRDTLADSDLGKVRNASMAACCWDNWKALQLLLAHTPAHAREPMMLSHAAENNGQACLELLLAARANPDSKGRSGLSALEMAALKGYSRVVEQLLGAKANPDFSGSFTPVASAAFSNNGRIAEALVLAKADLAHRHRNDAVPLHIAAREGATEVVMALINSEADVNPQESKESSTPMHLAAQRGNTEVVKVLIGAKANVNALSRRQNSPLHNAAWEGMSGVVQALLEGRANPEIRNGSGCTALEFATERHRDYIVQLLGEKV